MENRPIIALVGRPNVGKSTMFNRLIGRREAITSHIAGTTRDRNFGVMEWFGHVWTVVDTAGVIYEEDLDNVEINELQKSMEEQVEIAVAEATLVALVVDVKEGLHPIERTIINELRKHEKPMIILANKADNEAFRTQSEMFRELGVDDIFPISAIHGAGVGDLTDFLIEHYPSRNINTEDDEDYVPRVSFIGRPNVGKSTLLNRVVGEDRSIVSPVAGTTRDAVQDEITLPSGRTITVVDTAGIRRRGQIGPGIEKFSLFRALKAINRSDVVVLLLTIEENPTRGDAHVAMYALEAEKKIIIAVNKADLAIQDIFKLKPSERERLADRYMKRFAFLQRMPTYFISAETGEGVDELLKAVEDAVTEGKSKKTSE